MIFW